MKTKFVLIALISVLLLLCVAPFLSAQQSNFSIAPPPVPYLYFDDGREDMAAGASYVSISTADVSLKGGFFDFKGRQAFSGLFALDVLGGLGVMKGTMPGIPPLSPIYTTGTYNYVPYFTQVTGDASLTFFNFLANPNIEIQPVRTELFDIIIFGGFTMTYSTMTMYTPYQLIVPPPYSNAGETFSGYTNTLTITSTIYGYQLGLQCDLALSENIRLSPFVMMSTTSGNATMVSNPGTAGGSSSSIGVTIPSSTTYSFGMDILLGNFSIGTVLQQLKAAGEQNQDTKVIMISAGYHFSTGGEAAAAE